MFTSSRSPEMLALTSTAAITTTREVSRKASRPVCLVSIDGGQVDA